MAGISQSPWDCILKDPVGNRLGPLSNGRGIDGDEMHASSIDIANRTGNQVTS